LDIALRVTSYAIIGVINVMVDISVFFIGYGLVGLPLLVANVVSWSVSVTGSYVMNSHITFAQESGRRLKLRAYVLFVCSGIVGLIADTTTLVVCSWYTQIWVAKLVATLIGFLVNFSMSHFVVFPRRACPPRMRADIIAPDEASHELYRPGQFKKDASASTVLVNFKSS
jgi:putative flippase GtrA